MRSAAARPAGRPRDPELDRAILAAAEQQLREAGYAGMSLESVAAAAGTTVPAVRRRFRSKASVAVAVIDSLRVESMSAESGPPRGRALAVLRNFGANLLRSNSMAVVGTLLAEEHRHPELLASFRLRLVEPRRAALRRALAEGISGGELPDSADPDVLASMLIGSFYARYIATSDIPGDWAEQALRQVWPDEDQPEGRRRVTGLRCGSGRKTGLARRLAVPDFRSRRGHTGLAALATDFRSRNAAGTAARITTLVRANAAG
jgi:AcrR family transcriptional regulator